MTYISRFNWCLIVLVFIFVLSCTQNVSLEETIARDRFERDESFKDPLTSALATVGIALLKKETTLFGSGPRVDLLWKDRSIKSRHARILMTDTAVFIESVDGQVLRHPDHELIDRTEWRVGEKFKVGAVYLVLQIHPVGPVVRIIDPDSPELAGFSGLHYYPVDPEFRVKGQIKTGSKKKIRIMDTQGWQRDGWIYGRVEFEIKGIHQGLDLLVFEENPTRDSRFMLMFKDQTSNKQTYPAGRYLFLPFQDKEEMWIDFNLAVNPSCAYGKGFACPLPPPGNHLKVAIEAGEKTYSSH